MMHKKPGGISTKQPEQHRASRRITLHKQCPSHRTLLLISALTALGVPAIILATGAAAAALTGGLLLAALGVAWHLRCEELRTRNERFLAEVTSALGEIPRPAETPALSARELD